jgi:hypothetical protein
MFEEQIKSWMPIWGAGLSSVLGAIKLWEVCWRDRVRLSITYSFSGSDQEDDEVTIVNLSNQTIQVSHWSLAWRPKLWKQGVVTDLTPCERGGRFRIDPKSEHTLVFSGEDKFAWGAKASNGRSMCLTLWLFGRKRPMKLVVKRD